MKYHHLNTGELFYNFRLFNGYMFLDKYLNFFDTVHKRYYGNYNCYFKGDGNNIPFILFDNNKDELINEKIKEGVEKMNKEQDETIKNKIESDIAEELIQELTNYRIENFKFKNGYFYNNYCFVDQYDYIHDNITEKFSFNIKIYEGEFIQVYDNLFPILRHGRGKSYDEYKKYYPKTEDEYFYNQRIGRSHVIGEKEEKFFCDTSFYEKEKKGDIIIYCGFRDKIILEINSKKKNNPGRILVKDVDGEKIIYEISVKTIEDEDHHKEKFLKPKGIGIVKDHRNGELLIVNFDSNNILSNNLQDLTSFLDKEELGMNKDINSNNINSFNPIQEITINYPKEYINNIISNVTQNNNIEKLANKINEKIIEEKIKYLGIKDQKYSEECWVYSLSEIICLTNARKYGRKLDDFNKIYDDITKQYGKI